MSAKKTKPKMAVRKAPDPRALEAFIHGTPVAPPGLHAVAGRVRPPGKATDDRGRVVLARADGRDLVRSTFYLPPELAQRLRLEAFESGKDQSAIVALALAAHFEPSASRKAGGPSR